MSVKFLCKSKGTASMAKKNKKEWLTKKNKASRQTKVSIYYQYNHRDRLNYQNA
jgi:hypothetical protein